MVIQNNNDRDTTIDEIHQTRERMAEKFGGDVAAIIQDAQKRQAASGRAVWHRAVTNKALHPPVG
jgi:hypothetical protein